MNSQKQDCEQNVVMGASMGGIIARYALASMEQNGQEHQTRLYVSVDAPHQGANVPPGLQKIIPTPIFSICEKKKYEIVHIRFISM